MDSLNGLQRGPAVARSQPVAGVVSIGEQIGTYRIIRRLGAGAMGVVYEAIDLHLGRRVAIKVLRSSVASPPVQLLTEARTAACLEHERFVRVYALATLPSGQPYMVMEYLRGVTLRQWLTPRKALRAQVQIFNQLVDGVAFAHRRGVVHRDLKPENVFVTGDAQVKILDLGLAGLVLPPCSSTLQRAELPILEIELAGTPAYLPPETWRGAAPSPQVDVWALGVILYEVLSGGQHPFWLRGCAVDFNVQRVLAHPYAPLAQLTAGLPGIEKLDKLVQQALARDERQRYADAGAFRQAWADWLALSGGHEPADAAASESTPYAGGARGRLTLRHRAARDCLVTGSALLSMFLWAMDTGPSSSAWSRDGMAFVPGGTYTLGSSRAEIEAAHHFCNQEIIDPRLCLLEQIEREQPPHTVTVSSFWMSRTEVTNQKFAAWLNQLLAQRKIRLLDQRMVVASDDTSVILADIFPFYQPANTLLFADGVFLSSQEAAALPVTQVTWEGARRYCEAQAQRLPTEAEWEYAARSGGKLGYRFPWGNTVPRCDGVTAARTHCLVPGRSGGPSERIPLPCLATHAAGPTPVGTSPQDVSAQGIYDLAGNVAEWVADPFVDRYPDCGKCQDPVTSITAYNKEKPQRVFRGGSWTFLLAHTRAAARSRLDPRIASREIGFRCVRPEPRLP